MVAPATVVLDCRWLNIGGPGRTTELMLRGFAEDPPPGRWVLWGPEALERLAWPDAEIVRIETDPRRALGQRNALDIPLGALTVFMHQQRPLRRMPAVTTIYDTIALRYGSTNSIRAAKRLFLRRIAASSRHILTISEHSKASVVSDLGASPDNVTILRFPFDDSFVDRVLRLRSSLDRSTDTAVYVGGFLPHKNLPRLIEGFAASRFCKEGGELVLAGGTPDQATRLEGSLTPAQREFVRTRTTCSQSELESLFATSLFLIQPSLEEGFGLPAWEALCSGLPVCASDGGALPEVVKDFLEPFPATSVAAMTDAIDDCAGRALAGDEGPARIADLLRRTAPTVRQFAAQFHDVIDSELASVPWS